MQQVAKNPFVADELLGYAGNGIGHDDNVRVARACANRAPAWRFSSRAGRPRRRSSPNGSAFTRKPACASASFRTGHRASSLRTSREACDVEAVLARGSARRRGRAGPRRSGLHGDSPARGSVSRSSARCSSSSAMARGSGSPTSAVRCACFPVLTRSGARARVRRARGRRRQPERLSRRLDAWQGWQLPEQTFVIPHVSRAGATGQPPPSPVALAAAVSSGWRSSAGSRSEKACGRSPRR